MTDLVYVIERKRHPLVLDGDEVDVLNRIGGYGHTEDSIFVLVRKKDLEELIGDGTLNEKERKILRRLIEVLPWNERGECDLEIVF